MRDIKFRAWNHDSKRMSEVFDLTDDIEWYKDERPCYDLMQFTGLTDKNGKEIYEGDILATENDGKDGADEWKEEIIGAVDWDNQYAQFTNMPSNDDESIYSLEYVKVVGNIYENPELLKQ